MTQIKARCSVTPPMADTPLIGQAKMIKLRKFCNQSNDHRVIIGRPIMAMTNAQIQAAYKARHLKDENGTSERLDVLIDSSAKLALKRLAAHYRVSQRSLLQTLITEKQTTLLETMDSGQQAAFYDAA